MKNEWKFSDNTAIYLQIVEKLQKKIVSGELSPGDKLPPVRELAGQAGVNPNTMMRALSDLESNKLLYTLRGNGKYVTEDREVIASFKEELASKAVNEFLLNMKALGFSNDEIKKYNINKEEVI